MAFMTFHLIDADTGKLILGHYIHPGYIPTEGARMVLDDFWRYEVIKVSRSVELQQTYCHVKLLEGPS
jgi:hypothetical protein